MKVWKRREENASHSHHLGPFTVTFTIYIIFIITARNFTSEDENEVNSKKAIDRT